MADRGEDGVGPGDSRGAFEAELLRLKRAGGTVLVVGDVGPEVRADATRQLLGDGSPYRTQVLALLDHPTVKAGRFVVDSVDTGSERFGLLVPDDALTRSASTPTVGRRSAGRTDGKRAVELTPSGVGAGIRAAVDARYPPAGEWPVDLRVGVVTLRLLLDWAGVGAVAAMLANLGAAVRAHGGIVHGHLPTPVDDPRRAHLVDHGAVDIVVELRTAGSTAEQRWTLPGAAARSDWLRLHVGDPGDRQRHIGRD